MSRSRRIVVFVSLAYVLAWPLAFIFFGRGSHVNSVGFVMMGTAFMFTPALAGIITQRFVAKQPLRVLFGGSPRWRWIVIGWLLPMLFTAVTLAISASFPGVQFVTGIQGIYAQLADKLSPEQLVHLHRQLDHSFLTRPGILPAAITLQILVAGATVNAVAALGEELGWRGFLYQELRRMNFWFASLFTGVIWGLWHLPIIINGYNYPGHPVGGVLMMTLLTILIAPLIAYLRLRANSVFAPAVFHGTFNAAAGAALFLHGGGPMTVGPLGIAGMLTLLGANVVLWVRMSRDGIAVNS
ncbi:MAG: CPBP family intramembrane metalloprotease, partial [Verrucomicrobiota bacterium]|nr:CPBP family intramembrane metalloprotease [Verrucomicrobiota bacterium]